MKKKFIIVPLFILLLGGIGYYYFSQKPTDQVKIDMNDIVTVSTGAIENRVDVVAKVSLENKESLTFKQTGKVAKVLVKEGQTVRQGDVLAKLDMKDYEITLASSKISLDNAKISLQKASEGATEVEIESSKNKIEEAARKITILQSDFETLNKDKETFEFTRQREIDENFANISVTEKKIENLSVDVELAKKQLELSLEEIQATGDSRLRTTYSNLQSALLDLRDAQSFYKKLLSIETATDPNFLLLGNSQLRSNSIFGYAEFVKNVSETEKIQATFDPKTATIEEAKIIANSMIRIMKSCVDFNAGIKVLIEETMVGGYYSDSLLNSYKSSVSSYASKFTSASNSASSNIRELSTGNTIETTELSTQASLLSKETSFASMKLELQRIKNSDISLRRDLKMTKESYDTKLQLKKSEITAAELSLSLIKKEHEELLKGPDILDVRQAQNSLQQAENSHAANVKKGEDYLLVAPMDGTISSLVLKERFTASTSAALVIENRDMIGLKALLDQSQVVKIRSGATAKIYFDAYKKQGFDAIVSFIESVPTESSGVVSYTVKLVMKRPEGVELYDAMTATAQIYLDSVDDAIRVPLAAIQEDTDGKFVQLYDGKRLRKQVVTLGKSDTIHTQVLTGLKEGDKVSITAYATTTAQRSSNPLQSLFGGSRRSGATGGQTGGMGSQGSTRGSAGAPTSNPGSGPPSGGIPSR